MVEALRGLQSSTALSLEIYGMINFVDDLNAASDLVISKSGGLITSEVLARGVPMVVIEPIPGQEEWNADYVVSSGAGVQLRLPYAVPRMAAHLLAQPQRLSDMRACATAIGKPRAAFAVVDQVLDELMNKRHG
jgi:processive 1,2-diacylglycerol beta-glucosyltransferase